MKEKKKKEEIEFVTFDKIVLDKDNNMVFIDDNGRKSVVKLPE